MVKVSILVHRVSLLHQFRQVQPLIDVAGEKAKDVMQKNAKAADMRPGLRDPHESGLRPVEQARFPQKRDELLRILFVVLLELLGRKHDLREVALGVDQIAAKCIIHTFQEVLVLLRL